MHNILSQLQPISILTTYYPKTDPNIIIWLVAWFIPVAPTWSIGHP
jgi:hypothetical protein